MVPGVAAEGRPRQARPLDLLVGRTWEYARLGDTVELGFSGRYRLLIEAVARLGGGGTGAASSDGVVLGPGDDASEAVGAVLGDTVRAAVAGGDGGLRIGFGGGAELLVGADDEAESWAVVGPGGLLIVCMPGGDLATWRAGPG